MRIHESDLLDACIAGVFSRSESTDVASRFLWSIDPLRRGTIVAELRSLLSEQAGNKVEIVECEPSRKASLDSRILSYKDKTGDEKTVFFNITDAAMETAFPIVGVFLTLMFGRPTISAAVSIASVGKVFWSKVITLSSSRDSIALATLRAIGVIRASHFAGFPEERIVGAEFPSTEEICARVDSYSKEQVYDSLKRLDSLRLIECKYWGDQTGDYKHDANRWSERL